MPVARSKATTWAMCSTLMFSGAACGVGRVAAGPLGPGAGPGTRAGAGMVRFAACTDGSTFARVACTLVDAAVGACCSRSTPSETWSSTRAEESKGSKGVCRAVGLPGTALRSTSSPGAEPAGTGMGTGAASGARSIASTGACTNGSPSTSASKGLPAKGEVLAPLPPANEHTGNGASCLGASCATISSLASLVTPISTSAPSSRATPADAWNT